jgi:hypothetical protein
MGRQMRRGGIEPSDLTAEVNRVAENTQQVGSKLANRLKKAPQNTLSTCFSFLISYILVCV